MYLTCHRPQRLRAESGVLSDGVAAGCRWVRPPVAYRYAFAVHGVTKLILGKTTLFRAVRSSHIEGAIIATALNPDAPGIATHFAILDEAAPDIRLHVNLDLFAAIRARDQKLVGHCWWDLSSVRVDVNVTIIWRDLTRRTQPVTVNT